jgi:hypothetical protein
VIGKISLRPGDRVRLRSAPAQTDLQGDPGSVVRRDEWAGYYIVRLDRPALYHHADGRVEELPEICEAADNLAILPPPARGKGLS